eukprot:CAMPEP_0173065644 /NCGR_PEP_ID=MMETSP1102-20130122/5735_1 /TAXON_ID=49646 /ORGANISM="Geminigera sp., Strain Caron Lab Isolate" /LENGTH=106 /DNA_ID=CAMNT_0013932943 /DNA_START=165 /DNA_END=482 /DNA_ORIENTATION=+
MALFRSAVMAMAMMATQAVAFAPSSFKAAPSGLKIAKSFTCSIRPTRSVSLRLSDEDFAAIVKEGYGSPEGSEAREAWMAAVKVRQQEDFDRSRNQEFMRPEFKEW